MFAMLCNIENGNKRIMVDFEGKFIKNNARK